MKNRKGVSLPHPVLGLGDDINGSFKIDVQAIIQGQELIIQEKSIEINNDYFSALHSESKIATAYKISCASTLYSSSHVNGIDIKIPCSELSHNVVIESFLIAIENINNYTHDSFNPDSKLGQNQGIFVVQKGSVVGDAGESRIELDNVFVKGISGIVEFKPVSIDSAISIDTDNPKIIIGYPKKEGELDMVNILSQKNSKFKNTFLNLFLLPALTHAFSDLIEAENEGRYDDFIEKYQWASVIDYMSESIEKDDDPYIRAQLFLKSIIEVKLNIAQPTPIVSSFNELKEL